MKDESKWQKAAEDIKRFRKGYITKTELKERYPELNIQDDYIQWENVKESIYIRIPKECPIQYAVKIAIATEPRKNDNNRADRWLSICVAYRPEWDNLKQVGKLQEICKEKKDIKFDYCYVEGKHFVLRYCIAEGDNGDEGFGMTPDTWLIGELDLKGNWIVPFYLEN